MQKINILGVNIHKVQKDEILKKIHHFLSEDKYRYLVTPNPEIILKTKEDEELFYIINHADLSLADGMGLKLAGFIMGKNIKRFTGADLTIELLKEAEEKGLKIAILNWRGGLSRKSDIEIALKNKFPKLICHIQDIDRAGKTIDKKALNNFQPNMLFSTLGSPWQEKNIYYLKDKIKNLKLALAVGGSFDFITGRKKRAPLFFRRTGFEWFWRLLMQPSRIKRIYKATFVFSFKFLFWRFVHPLLYRPNVACLLYKKEAGKIKILLVERVGDKNHWQIPQGGTDGESLGKAGAREMREELGNNKFRKVLVKKNVHKYRFPENFMSKYNFPAKFPEGYKGQKQGLFVAEFLGGDSDIKINFWEHSAWRWVELERVVDEVHPLRKRAMEKFVQIIQSNEDKL